MTEYMKIPECTIYSAMTPYRVGLYTFLFSRKRMDGKVSFSIMDACDYFGVKPDNHKGKINHTLYSDLEMMQVFDYFKSAPDFREIKEHECGKKTTRELTLADEIFNPSGRFAVIRFDELQAILNYGHEQKERGNKINIAHALLLLAYIRVNINKSKRQPRCCYRLYSSIESDLNLSLYNIKKALDVLQELDIITVGETSRTCIYDREKKTKSFTNPFKIFADSHTYLNRNGKVIVNKNYNPLKEIEAQKLILKNKHNSSEPNGEYINGRNNSQKEVDADDIL